MPSRWDRVKSALWIIILLALVGGLAYSLRPPAPLGHEVDLTSARQARQPFAPDAPLSTAPPRPASSSTPRVATSSLEATPTPISPTPAVMPSPARTTTARRPAPSPTLSQRININTASKTELDRLPGIGPALADRIIQYRQANGPFQQPEDLKKVSGIGEKIFDGLKDLVSVR